MPAIYTLEASFSDTIDGKCYTPELLKSIGRDVCRALIPYCGINVPFPIKTYEPNSSQNENKDKSKFSTSIKNSENNYNAIDWKNMLINELKRNNNLLEMGDNDEDSSGSESHTTEDDLPHAE